MELDQRKLANHMDAMRSAPTARLARARARARTRTLIRLDGESWAEATVEGAVQKETTEMRAPVGATPTPTPTHSGPYPYPYPYP